MIMVQHNMMGQDNMILSFPVFTSKLQKKKKNPTKQLFVLFFAGEENAKVK